MFFSPCPADHRDLHSFPTRRSSDLTPTGPADHRAGTQDQQSPDGPLAPLRDGSELVLAACRLLQRRQPKPGGEVPRSEEHTSELQSRQYLVCRLLLEEKKVFDDARN